MAGFSTLDFLTKALRRSLKAGNYDGLIQTAAISKKMSATDDKDFSDPDTTFIIHHPAPTKNKK